MLPVTIFSVNLYKDNNIYNKKLNSLCIKSGKKLYKVAEGLGYDLNIKLYDYDSPEFIEFKNKYPLITKCYENLNLSNPNKIPLSGGANAFRIYILSKYPNHIGLDVDIFAIENNLEMNFKKLLSLYFDRSFHMLSNCGSDDNLELYQKLMNLYSTGMFNGLLDREVYKILKDNYFIDFVPLFGLGRYREIKESLIHLSPIDNVDAEKGYLFTGNPSELDGSGYYELDENDPQYSKKGKEHRKEKVLICIDKVLEVPCCDVRLCEDLELINILMNEYNLELHK